MKLIDRIKSALTPTKTSFMDGVVSQKNFTNEQLLGYNWACIQTRSRYVSAVDIYLEQGKGWILNPNTLMRMSINQLYGVISESLDCTGNAFLYAPKGQELLWYIPTRDVELIKGSGFITGYNVTFDGTMFKVPKEEIIHIRNFNFSPNRDIHFLGRPSEYDAVSDSVSMDTSMVSYMNDYFDNGAVPPMVYTSANEMRREQAEQIKQSFQQLFKTNPPSLFIAHNNSTFTPLENSSNSLQGSMVDGSVSLDVLKRITSAYGMNPNILFQEFANKSTIETMMSHFLTYTIEPIVNKIETALNQYLLENGYKFQLKHQPPTFTDTEKSFNQQIQLLQNGVISVEEMREYLGLNVTEVKKKALKLTYGLQSKRNTQSI